MNTKAFLEEILPAEGYIVLAEFRTNAETNSKFIVHHFYTDFEEAAEQAIAIDKKGNEVYHACATYATDENRKQSNVLQVKSFWLDIDVGKADSYQSQKEAVAELGAVCGTLGLKLPTMVSSGRGIHCYWVFTNPITVDVWKTNVSKFRAALDALNFKHDPARTTDQASILRPVGTTWRKNGERAVRLIRQGSPSNFSDIMSGIEKFLIESNIESPRKTFPIFEVERLTQKTEYPPSSAVMAASMCGQLKRMQDLKGAISEPEWRNAIGVIKHCTEGDALCHQWSQGDPRYDHDETQRKIEGWMAGPTTCESFDKTNHHICDGCKFKGKITSPIQLGYTAAAEAPTLEQPIEVTAETVDYMAYWPKNFRWDESSSRLLRLVKGEDGAPDWVDFCDTLFYPTTRVQMEDGTWALRYSMQVTKNKWRQFEIPTKLLTSMEGYAAALASYEVIIYPRKGMHAMSYTQSWLEKFKQTGVEINTFKHYGWHEDFKSFLIGDRLLLGDGSENSVIRATNITPGSRIHTDFTNFTPEGDSKEWAGLFNEIYNRPNTEHFQFTALCLMAAPLVALFDVDSWHGIPVALTGDGGHGKTSLGMAACSIYGRGKSFVFDTKNSTMNAFDPFVGGLRNLPCVLDELTGRDPRQVSDKLYALSNGGGRDRADQKGNMSAVRHKWDLISLITGNTNITESMHQLEKQQADASSVRIFEITITSENGKRLFEGVNVPERLNELSQLYGTIGREFLKASMFDRVKMREAFLNLRSKYGYESSNYDPRERFFIDLIATAIVGGKLLQALGYIKFDLNKVRDWAINHIMEMRLMRNESTYSADDQLAAFFGSIVGHVVYTKEINRAHLETPMDSHRLLGDVKARISIGKGTERILVSSRAMDEWCTKMGVQPRLFRKQLRENGYIRIDAPEKFTLTVGTNLPSAQERVVEFVYDKVINVAQPTQENNKVVRLR
jgi:hypothetical protein